MTVHNLRKQNLCPSSSSDDYTVLPLETNFNTIQELLLPRLGTEPSTWSRGRLGASHQQQLLRRQQQVNEIKSQLTDPIWPKRFRGVMIYQDCNLKRNIASSFCYIRVLILKSLSSKDTSDLWRGTG